MTKPATSLPRGDYVVYCHRCHVKVRPELMRAEATMHGSPRFGGLWHCALHADDCPLCPHNADYCDEDCSSKIPEAI